MIKMILLPSRILSTVKIATAAVFARVLKFAPLLTKYSYWFFCVFIFFSCQRNLTQTDISPNSVIKDEAPATAVTEKFSRIDTLRDALANHFALNSTGHVVVSEKIKSKIERFYDANAQQTKWLQEHAPHALYYALLEQFKNASRYGLNANDYGVNEIEEQMHLLYRTKPVSKSAIVNLDIHLSEIFFRFAAHLRDGRITDAGYGKYIWLREMKNDNDNDIAMLVQTRNALQLRETIDKLQPVHEQYAKLQKALEVYRSVEKISTPGILISEKIKPGETHVAIPSIRKKLTLIQGFGNQYDSTTELTDSLLYDGPLIATVKAFQQQHGLEADGVIGGKTLKYLNQSFKEKADLIALNMERMRWLPDNFGDHYILVNIPEYKLRIYEQEKQALEMNVIVGAVHSATPVFRDTLEHVVFSPTWTVPPSIMRDEIFTKLKRNPNYYTEKNYSFYKSGILIDPSKEKWDTTLNVYQYRVVQKPGADNALGLVKFVMPNTMNIYLHDTPDHSLFSKNFRALSHGCIRLNDPAKLAEYLLQEEKSWDASTIRKAMQANKPASVSLKKQYPVHLQYITAWVDDNGHVNFREDIYGHDKRQLQQLNGVKKLYPGANTAASAAP